MERMMYAMADGVAIARRNVIKIKRVPEILLAVLISPLVFVLLFAYVFGSSIDIPGGSYREFLIGGTFALTLTFGAVFTGAGLAEDMQKGIIDRFRPLPMSRSAVVFGRTASDVIYNVFSLIVMALAGLAVGGESTTGSAARWRALPCCCCSPTRSRGSWPMSACSFPAPKWSTTPRSW
jgi:hypothetical protein